MSQPVFIQYLAAGAYIAIMIAVLGVPQLLSSYFDHRTRRMDRAEDEANAERRHQEILQTNLQANFQAEERRREERAQEEERRHQVEERRRQEMELSDRRHQELMALLIASLGNGGNQSDGQSQRELIRALQQTVEDLRAETARLRQQNGNGNPSPSA